MSEVSDGASTQKPEMPLAPVSAGFMAIYGFTQFAHWLALLTPVTITIALRIDQISTPAEKGTFLAIITSIGAFCAMISGPIWGAISDHTTARIGRRKLWIIIGALLLLCGLAIMAVSTSLLVFGIGWIVCQVGSNAAQSSLSAILPDNVPLSQRGRMSSILGLTVTFAVVSGTFITQFTHSSSVAMFLIPWLPYAAALLLILKFLPDSPSESSTGVSFASALSVFKVNPFKDRDFGLAFVCRFLLMTGKSFAQTYQVYVLIDVIRISSSQVPRTLLITTTSVALIGSLFTLLAGILVDRTGRMKPFVFFAGILSAAGLFTISQANTLLPFIVGVVVLGVAKNVFSAVATALTASVLPSRSTAAKDMGIVQIANSLPQSLAPAIAPFFLAIGGGSSNYAAVFLAATVFSVAGALAILPIRRVK